MPEQLRTQEPVEPPIDAEVSPLTYGDVLNDPNTHEALHPHLQRLAAGESSADRAEAEHRDETTDAVIQVLKECAAAEDFDPTKSFDSLNALSSRDALELYNTADYSVSQMAELIHAAVALEERFDADNAERRDIVGWTNNYNYVRTAASLMPSDLLQQLYFSEDNSEGIKKVLAAPVSNEELGETLKIFRKIYDGDTALDMMIPGGAAQNDPLVRAKLALPEAKDAIASELMIPSNWRLESPERSSTAKRDFADRYLDLVAGLPAPLRDDMLFAAHGRTSNPETGLANAYKLQALVADIAQKVEDLGTETTIKLREKAGIVNLDYYSLDQLKLMSDLINKDEEVINHLQSGDVTAVFTVGKGDYNGAMRGTSEEFATESGRTLVFELNEKGDLYRHMALLKMLGVKPSTIVFASHGDVGAAELVSSRDEQILLSNATPKDLAVSAKGLARIADELMQDSRGIDDDKSAIGRRRIFMKSCCQAKPVDVVRTVVADVREKPWHRKKLELMEMHRQESNAETLLRTMNNPKVDLYASDAPTWVRQTATGVRLQTAVEQSDGTSATQDHPITHFQLDGYGNVTQRQIEELVLRPSRVRVHEEDYDDFA